MCGWMSTLSWQAGTASGSFLTGTIIQALITVNNPNYDAKAWQGTLLVFAMVLVLFVANIWGARDLPMIQNILLVVHVFGFLAVIIVLWVMAPRNSAKVAFTQFTNEGGWPTMGLSLMVGQISAIYGSLCKSGPGGVFVRERVRTSANTSIQALIARPTWPKRSKTPAATSPTPCFGRTWRTESSASS